MDSATSSAGGAAGRVRGRERGATLVEYSLLVALLAVPTIGGIQMMENGAQTKVGSTAAGISTKTIPPTSTTIAVATTTTTSTTTTTAAPATTTTTTAAPTTTTTTAAPTTTTTTTTPPPATQSASSWGKTTTAKSGKGADEVWTATTMLTVTDDLLKPVDGAIVKVLVEYMNSNGKWKVEGTNTYTSKAGSVSVSPANSYGITKNLNNRYASDFRFTIQSVTQKGLTWDGKSEPTLVANPYD